MTLSTKLFCASINYQRLDERALANLHSAHLEQDKDFLLKFQTSLGLEVDSVAIIAKCNALILLITYQAEYAQDFVTGRVLMTWDQMSRGGIMDMMRDIRFHENIDALQFIAECAVGLHSVTVGDSQVFSQIVTGLETGLQNHKRVLGIISSWLKDVAQEVRLKTNLFSGNTSIERIACELIIERTDSQILMLGYGSSGKLIAKILNTENSLPLHILNRTPVDVGNEELDTSVTYGRFADAISPRTIRCLVVALDNTDETSAAVDSVLSRIQTTDDTLYIDLSTPSLLKGKISTCVDIEKLSELAHRNTGKRKDEVSKARNIVTKHLDAVVEAINDSIAKIYMSDQKKTTFVKLDPTKLLLAEERNQMLKSVRHFLEQRNFTEVTTPYIVGISTDPPKVDKGGTIDVHWMNGARAFLRQSNQIYKQILVASGMEKIYEIGPFWRREDTDSYRHLQESIGLDIEVREPSDLCELYTLACETIVHTYNEVTKKCDLKPKLRFPKKSEIPVLTYHESVKLLQENGNPVTLGDDLGLVSEAKLGQIIKNSTGSDIVVVKDYPDTIKKFYTKEKQGGLTETFDVIVDGWELVSGAIRQTNGAQIRRSMALSRIDAANYEFYISAVDNSVSHGGFCLGLDRLMAKILDKKLVSEAVLFPRSYKRLVP